MSGEIFRNLQYWWARMFASLRLVVARIWGRETVRSAYGIDLAANYDDVTFRFYVTGAYGQFYADHLAGLNCPFFFLDIGANQGLYTVLAARNENCAGVIAFEPVSETAEFCAQNIALNQVQDRVTLKRQAISDRAGLAEIKTNIGHSGGASLAEGNGTEFAQSIQIETINREALAQLDLPADLPLIVKIDVEGHEEIVLRELFASPLGGRIKDLFFEVDPRWVDPQSLRELVEQQGFATQEVRGFSYNYDLLCQR